jgi:polar amino acid transport system substrate-binding protein
MTPERSLDFALVGPYYVSGKTVLTKSDELANAGEIETFDREGLKLVALAGSTSETFVKERLPKAELTTVPDYDKAVAMVLEDRVAAMVADLPACVVTMLRNPDKGLKMSGALLTTEPIGIALPPDQPRFESYVTNILEAIDDVGELDALADYWFKGAGWLSGVP